MRAAQPNETGTVEHASLQVSYEVFGSGTPTLVLMPTWCVVHSRIWKMQIPYLSRHFRVVVWDGPGNGAADRPTDPAAYSPASHVALTNAVLDATGTDRAILLASSGGTRRTLTFAREHPARCSGVVLVGPYTPLTLDPPDPGWVAAFVGGDHHRFLDVFMAAAFNEPHSSKAIEDGVAWGRETTMAVLGAAVVGDEMMNPDLFADPAYMAAYREACARVTCPVLIVQGDVDLLTPESGAHQLAAAIGENASVVVVEGGGHRQDVRDPVKFGHLVREFVERVHPSPPKLRRWTRAAARPKRALFLSSPIGLGHVRRDVAIARELRALHPDLAIDWLAQDPVTQVLAAEGERVHPAGRHLVNESAHFEGESAEHDLHCFHAFRSLDETLTANFMLLHDVLSEEHYDLVIGDEAWETDHFLHENPELKRTAYAWLTDFVGWLPMPAGGEREVALTADYNLEMLTQVERYRRIRDAAIFVGDPEDVVPHDFGPGLPNIREWTERHFDFCGYVTGFEPLNEQARAAVRAEFGIARDERVVVVTVGGTAVGASLLRKVLDAYPLARRTVPELRMVAVTGPRIDPRSLPEVDGVLARGFVPDLYRLLGACDLAVVQGGLTTAMELTSNGRPFLYFPLGNHFEQRFHVPHRLARYGAGRRMEYSESDPDAIAAAIVEEVGRTVDYRPVATDGARRAAALLGGLI
ncbi:MAG: alpha/beta fold hydrolase [Sporichthyaceae bacterium]